MTNAIAPAKALPTVASPNASALGLAICATFATGSAQANPIAFDIFPEITLGNYTLNIGPAEYTFQREVTPILEDINDTQNNVDTGSFSVVGFEVLQGKLGTYATALAAGEQIDATSGFVGGSNVILSGKLGILPYGDFFNSGTAYVGLRFDLPSGTHFGWVGASGGDQNNLVLTSYGYECAPDTGIAAGAGTVGASCQPDGNVPEPGTLALLIAGAAGVAAMRRRQRAA